MNIAAPLLLVLYAASAATSGPRLMRLGRWVDRSPAASIVLWQALCISTLLSVVLAGVDLAVPRLPLTTDVADLLRACAEALAVHYATPGGAITSGGGAILASAVLVRTAWSIGRQLWISKRQCVRQRHAIRLVGRPGEVSGSLVVESSEVVVYCVPGRRHHHTVVFTSAALAKLDPAQVAAVLAHENVHLRARHHLVLGVARGLERAFPFVALFTVASTELARLVEMHADDTAAKRHDRRVLATALLFLAEARSPVGSLGAGGGSTVRRVSRLAQPPRPLPLSGSLAMSVTVLAMVTLPIALIALPALSALAVHYCPVNWT